MRRVIPTMFLLGSSVALAGCRGDSSKSACDLDALTSLSETLAAEPVAEQVTIVWPGIVAACADALPMPLADYFARAHDPTIPPDRVLLRGVHPVLAGLQRRACPNIKEVAHAAGSANWEARTKIFYDGCEYARYGVISADEIAGTWNANLTWATHQWLLDQGLDSGAAKPITRALYTLNQFDMGPVERLPDLRLPEAHGVPIAHGVPLHVTRRHIHIMQSDIATLTDGVLAPKDLQGHVIPKLQGILRDEFERAKAIGKQLRNPTWEPTAVIGADADLPMATVADVAYTVAGSGFTRYAFAVAPEGFQPTYIPVLPPRRDLASDDPEPQFMRIELTSEALTLSRGRARAQTPQAHALTQLDAVTSFAEAVHRDDPSTQLVISAAADVRLEQTLRIIAAARGPKCSETGDGCLIPEVILLIEDAHTFDPRPPPKQGQILDAGLRPLAERSGVDISTRSKLSIVQGEVVVSGELPANIIVRIVRAHVRELESCYDLGLTRDSALRGSVVVDFVIGANGKVRRADVDTDESTLSDARVRSCIAKAFKRWRFPKLRESGSVRVSYPFEFSSK